MEHSDFDCLKEKQSFGPGTYNTTRTNSQYDTVSVQTSGANRFDGIRGQFCSTQLSHSGGGLGSWITDDMKRMFYAVYRKHGSVKERRELNIAYRHIVCERCLARNKTCKIQSSAFQCGNCPTYMKCSRVPILNKLRVLHVMNITEQQYESLLTWYKKSVDEQIAMSMTELTKIISVSHPHEIENSTNMQLQKIHNEFPNRRTIDSGQEDLTYGYSVDQKHRTTSISPISVDSSTSYLDNEQSPLRTFLTPINPYYTPTLSYPSPCLRLPAPTAQYEILNSSYQQFSENPRCENASEYCPNIRSRHDDPRTYTAGSEAPQSSMVQDEKRFCMSSHQICVNEFDRCNRATPTTSDSLHYDAYTDRETGTLRYITSSSTMEKEYCGIHNVHRPNRGT
ncbi:uncharacterized protein C8R40DRAFT_1068938 [Lentinula edodes]|uniref:uncharacterized protein n=1 Tax=Lentinula edodes TaxID=5353 RepID=UPI001E8DE84C|nr:uncharacterized protein C8R40DRAFT_1068938 [Lentinula edodes]KAH7876158.1 hypothetical protein C8R40DRAFT_1068938 [Lentinula edodes]KAJ3911827.1 hypothetical protein F5877DRAFT_72883 [Lentinula edodes]